jgi:hypothetical protein
MPHGFKFIGVIGKAIEQTIKNGIPVVVEGLGEFIVGDKVKAVFF